MGQQSFRARINDFAYLKIGSISGTVVILLFNSAFDMESGTIVLESNIWCIIEIRIKIGKM